MYYAPSTGGFYATNIHAAIPTDAVSITSQEHAALLAAQTSGKRIVNDEATGRPVAVDNVPTLEESKTSAARAIRAAFLISAEAPVNSNGQVWNGGFDSAIKLDAAYRLAQAAGANEVTFYDANNTAHTLDFASALTVVIGVSAAYQATLATKQSLMRAIAAASDTTAVAAVVWP